MAPGEHPGQHMSEHIDENGLLCESCGYSLAGLEAETGPCPECGSPIPGSLPGVRTGSPWQNRRGLASLWATHWGTLRRPGDRFRTLRIEPRSGTTLMLATIPIAAAFLVAPWTGTLIGDPARSARADGVIAQVAVYCVVFPLQVCLVGVVLLLLTWIESRGVRFFARRRRWKLTRDAAWQICAHASVGWVIGAVVPMLMMAVLFAAPTGRPSLLDKLLIRSRGAGIAGLTRGDATLLGLFGGAYVLGLCVFETLVYLGVRRCRFANPAARP